MIWRKHCAMHHAVVDQLTELVGCFFLRAGMTGKIAQHHTRTELGNLGQF